MAEPLIIASGVRADGVRRRRFGRIVLHGSTAGTKAVPGSYRSRYRLMLGLTDAGVIAASVAASTVWLFTAPQHLSANDASIVAVAAVLFAVWFGMTVGLRTRDPRMVGAGAWEYRRVLEASALTFGLAAVLYVVTDIPVAKGFFVVTWPAGVVLLLAGRWLWRQWLNGQGQLGRYLYKAVVVGRARDVGYVVAQMNKIPGAMYEVVGVVLEGTTDAAVIRSDASRVIPVVGSLDSVHESVQRSGADTVVVAGHLHRGAGYLQELSWKLEESGAELVIASALTHVAGPRFRIRAVEGLPLVHVTPPTFSGGRHLVKRAMDIVGSLVALIVFSPLLAIVALAIRLDSQGPVVFSQERVGKDGRTFRMYKFRSMVVDAEEQLARLLHLNEGNGILFKLREDPRVTRVGKWIRKFSLDELPQLYNVLRGDMSLVGPRPPLASEVSRYQSHTHRRLFIKPGCTGLWQVNGRSNLDWDESVRLDLYYVENWSVWGDLIIMWRTVKVMLNPVGAY